MMIRKKKAKTKARSNSNKKIYRKFIAYENVEREHVFKFELEKYQEKDITSILKKIKYFRNLEQILSPVYKNFQTGYYDIGRLRIGDFRIFVHRIDSSKWLMLHIFRKKSKKTPQKETNTARNRLIEYKHRLL